MGVLQIEGQVWCGVCVLERLAGRAMPLDPDAITTGVVELRLIMQYTHNIIQ